jgi:hypothetical protein
VAPPKTFDVLAMAGGNGLTAEMRERLERIVIQLLEIAARRELDPAIAVISR